MGKHKISIRNSHVSYWTYGENTNPPILFIHGFRGNHKGLQDLASEMTGYYVIIPDLPGYLESAPWTDRTHTISEYASWLAEFCDEIHLDDYIVVGHSFSATLAIFFAGHHGANIRKLILVAPVIAVTSPEAIVSNLYHQLARILPNPVRRIYLINPVTECCARFMLLKSSSLLNKIKLYYRQLQDMKTLNEQIIMENFISLHTTDPLEIAPNITIPTKIIAGTKDALSPRKSMEKLHDAIPNAVCEYILNEGHIIPMEQPASLARAIISFIYSSPA